MVVREERYLATFIFIIYAHLPENNVKDVSKIFILTFEIRKILSSKLK